MDNIKYKEFEIWESNDSGNKSISSGIPLMHGSKPFMKISYSGQYTVVNTLKQAIELMKGSIDLFLNGETVKREQPCLVNECKDGLIIDNDTAKLCPSCKGTGKVD